jgi:hypothetical protein
MTKKEISERIKINKKIQLQEQVKRHYQETLTLNIDILTKQGYRFPKDYLKTIVKS